MDEYSVYTDPPAVDTVTKEVADYSNNSDGNLIACSPCQAGLEEHSYSLPWLCIPRDHDYCLLPSYHCEKLGDAGFIWFSRTLGRSGCGGGFELGNGEIEETSDSRPESPNSSLSSRKAKESVNCGTPTVLRDKNRRVAEKSADSAFRRFLQTLGRTEFYLTEYTREDLDEVLAKFWCEAGLRVSTLYKYRSGLQRILKHNADGPAAHCNIRVRAVFPISSAAFQARIADLTKRTRMRIQEEWQATIEEESEAKFPLEDPLGFRESTPTASLSHKRGSDFEYKTENMDLSEGEEIEVVATGNDKMAEMERLNSWSSQEFDGLESTALDLSRQDENEPLSVPEEPRRKRQKSDDSGVVLEEETYSASGCDPGKYGRSSDEDVESEREAKPEPRRCEISFSSKNDNSTCAPRRRLRKKTVFKLLEDFVEKQGRSFSLITDSKEDLDQILAEFWQNMRKDDGSKLRARTLKCYNSYLRKCFGKNNWDISNLSDFPLAVVAFEEKLKRLRVPEEEDKLADSVKDASSAKKTKIKIAFNSLKKFLRRQGRSTSVLRDYSRVELDDILADFWLNAKKQDGLDFRAASLHCYKSSLGFAFRENKDGPAAHCDITNSSDFPRSSMAFSERFKDLIASEYRRSLENLDNAASSFEKRDSYKTRAVNLLRTFLHKQGRSISDIERCKKEDLDEILATFWHSLEMKGGSGLPLVSLRRYRKALNKFLSESKCGPAAYCDINSAIEFPLSTASYKKRVKDLQTAAIEKNYENFGSALLSSRTRKQQRVGVNLLQRFLQQTGSTSVLTNYRKEDLDEILASFWSRVKKEDGSEFGVETLRGYYRQLGAYFRQNTEGPAARCDIKDPIDFPKTFKAFLERCREGLRGRCKRKNFVNVYERSVVNLLREFLRKQGKSERFLTDYQKKDLDAVLADFWRNVLKKDGKLHQVRTLQTHRQALRRILLTNPDGLAPHCDLMLPEDFPKATFAFNERLRSLREKEERDYLIPGEDTQTGYDFVGCINEEETLGSESESERMDFSVDSFARGPGTRSHTSDGETQPEAREGSTGDKKTSKEQLTTRRSSRVRRPTIHLQERDFASESETEEWDTSEDDDWD